MRPKQIVVCLDGTWNDAEFGAADTNIVRIRNIVSESTAPHEAAVCHAVAHVPEIGRRRRAAGREVVLFYERGVGTGTAADRVLGGGFGLGLDSNVRRAYRFLSRTYAHGDEVFVFGFSRGAYTARSLVGYLASVGLLRPERCVPEEEARAWNYYRLPANERPPGVWRALGASVFDRSRFEVACLAVFDTVGALGIPLPTFRRANRQRYEFHDVEASSISRVNLHALAIDEHRIPFAASLWRRAPDRSFASVTEQVWFPGAHADVGGGYPRGLGKPSLDDVSLGWLLDRVVAHFPDFPAAGRSATGPSAPDAPQHEPSYPFLRRALRSIGNADFRPTGLMPPKLVGTDRHSPAMGERIHVSALRRLGRIVPVEGRRSIYAPENLLVALSRMEACYNLPYPASGQTLLLVGEGGTALRPNNEAEARTARNEIDQAVARMATFAGQHARSTPTGSASRSGASARE